MKKYIIMAIFCSLSVGKMSGQISDYASINYVVSFATGDFGDFISAPSFRGALIEYRKSMTPNLFLGIDLGWNTFYEKKDKDVYTSGTQSLSGVQYRYQNTVPIFVSADYIFMPDNALKPYVGLGIGTIYNERDIDMNLYRIHEKTWQFGVKPEVGFLYQIGYNTSIKFGAKYYNGFKTSKLDEQSYFSLNAGLTFNM